MEAAKETKFGRRVV